MATRLYLSDYRPNQINVAVGVPATAGMWDGIGSSSRRIMAPSSFFPLDEAAETATAIAEAITARSNIQSRQFITHPLAAQTITGTVKGQGRWSESNAAMDAAHEFSLRVVGPDGTVRGTLYQTAGAGTVVPSDEFATTLTNRYMPPGGSQSVSSVAVTKGDILVLEVGFRHYNTVSTSYTATFNYGHWSSRLDLPENQTETGALNPWIELSHNVAWLDELDVLLGSEDDLWIPVTEGILPDPPPTVPLEGQLWPRGFA